jgi:hypothetical protein
LWEINIFFRDLRDKRDARDSFLKGHYHKAFSSRDKRDARDSFLKGFGEKRDLRDLSWLTDYLI